MRLQLYGHNVDITPRLSGQVRRGLESAFANLPGQIGRVMVRIHAAPAAQDGITTCHVLVDLVPGGGVGLGVASPHVETAVERAFERVAVAASRELARRRGLPALDHLAYGVK
jgi:hypothetical protein